MSEEESQVRVVARVRPFIKPDTGRSCVNVNGKCVEVENQQTREVLRYSSESSQEELFEMNVVPLLQRVMEGANATVFAYGVTGAGKTYTMQGPETCLIKDPTSQIPKKGKKGSVLSSEAGIVPRTVEWLLGALKRHRDWKVQMSYLELYQEKVYDLLAERLTPLPIREDPQRRIVIPGLSQRPVPSVGAFEALYAEGGRQRSVAATRLNGQSSRSHAVLLLRLQWGGREAKVQLCDLAGSEDNRRTANEGVRLVESSAINHSLFVLGNVVNALNRKQSRIPYRDSKLTRLLQDALGGSAHALLIVNVAPSHNFFLDTFHTLNFALKAKAIVNKPTINMMEGEVESSIHFKEARVVEQETSRKRKSNELPQKKAKVPRNNKENVENIDYKAARVQELLSPWIRRQQLLDSATQQRLERLEQKLLEQSMDTVQRELGEFEEPVPVGKDLMTPCSRVRTAKNSILRAKQAEQEGDLRTAIRMYQEGSAVATDSQQLQQVLEEDEASPEAPETPYSPPLPSTKGSSGSHMPIRSFNLEGVPPTEVDLVALEKQLVERLATGTKKEIMQLAGVGEKRANAIVEFRELHPFTSISQLKQINGFGAKFVSSFVEKNAELASV